MSGSARMETHAAVDVPCPESLEKYSCPPSEVLVIIGKTLLESRQYGAFFSLQQIDKYTKNALKLLSSRFGVIAGHEDGEGSIAQLAVKPDSVHLK